MARNDNPSIQETLEAPMPLIGIYVALASFACSLIMAADLVHGFRRRKLWFPSKYFSLNATSLALLAVALKLPVDLTTYMPAVTDRLAKISSLSLMSTAVANFIPSLGAMSDGDILINVTALAILILTVVADVCIQIVGTRSFLHNRVFFPEEILALIFMLLLLLVLGSTAIMVLAAKKCLETKYQEKHRNGDNNEENLRNIVKKYWVMAETSSPQFVIARSSACAAAGVISFANAMLLAQAIVKTAAAQRSLNRTGSSYGCTTTWILFVQTVGVIVGTIPTLFRWFTAVRFRCYGADDRTLRQKFRVEDCWTRKLLEWQGSSIPHIFQHQRCRKLIYNGRLHIVDLVLGAQISIVLFNKLLFVISCFITIGVIKFIQTLEKMTNSKDSTSTRGHVVGNEVLQNVRPYSLRVDGVADLPDYMLQSIPKQVDEVLEAARREKPSGLIEYLSDSNLKFKGVAEFDSNRVPSIHGKEPKNCWSLPVVTLTSIAIALPNIRKSKVDQLVKDVRDALVFVKIVEKSFYVNQEWKNVTKAADLWLRVDLYRKWQDIDLAQISLTSSDCKHALRKLAHVSKNIASDLKTDAPDSPMFNPANWSPKIIAANSMYRISSTILDGCDEEKAVADEELFEEITRLIVDILAACLSNLACVIAKQCHLIAIEEREESIRDAALLLGRAEEIIEFLRLRELPERLDRDCGAAYIEKWRSAMLVEIEMSLESKEITPSSSGTASFGRSEVSN